jgi:hypothetical protein
MMYCLKNKVQSKSIQIWTIIIGLRFSIIFNKIIDKNIQSLKINLYDWIRCKVSFKSIKDL